MIRNNRLNNYNGNFKSTFLSCEKDAETIINKLLVESKPYSDMLKRLLLINTKDALYDMTNPAYISKINNTSVQQLIEQGYIRMVPKILMGENEEVKSYIRLSFDNFRQSGNPQFRDCIVEIDIICHPEYWDLGNFRMRPLKIAGYIDGILNNCKFGKL